MGLMKYFNEQSNELVNHGGRLYWSQRSLGSLAFPFRGESVPLLTESELTANIEQVWDFHLATFDLEDPQQAARYAAIMDRAVNGWFFIHNRILTEDPQTQRPRYVYLEWSQRYCQLVQNFGDALTPS